MLRQRAHPAGYLAVDLHAGVRAGHATEKKQQAKLVHRLVCAAFHGEPPFPRADVAHFDGFRTNNEATNLRWATREENHADKKRHGTTNHGVRNGQAKLTEAEARTVLQMIRSGATLNAAAARVGISPTHAGRIARGTKWAHLQNETPPPHGEAARRGPLIGAEG